MKPFCTHARRVVHSQFDKISVVCPNYASRKYVSTKSALGIAFDTKQNPKFNFNIGKKNAGLFCIPELTNANGFYELQEQVSSDTERLVGEVTRPGRERKVVQAFDELSDALCRVADMADFVRVSHPDKSYARAAEDACVNVGALVEKLNVNVDLYKALDNVVKHGDQFPEDDVDKRVAELFLFDFEQSGIHLEERKRQKFVEINEEILMTGHVFMQNCSTPVTVRSNQVPPSTHMWFDSEGDYLSVTGLFSDNQSDVVREAAYKIFLHENKNQSEVLDKLLNARYQLAQLVGFQTYGHRALRGTMAETPENVSDFLNMLAEEIMPKADKDYKQIGELKKKYGKGGPVQMWDYPFYSGLARQVVYDMNKSDLSAYFTLGNCMEGLNLLFTSLYGVSLQYEEPQHGEVWNHDVHKVAVVHESEGTLGYVYCDFYERPGKSHQDCHFTIRGGRLKEDGTYQLPAVVLHLNLPTPLQSRPCLLTPGMVENLFHEFGHAMHSMLGRTRYQHVTGTRCPTDFAEVPSVLMEYFFSDHRVLSQFAKHYMTNEPMPRGLIDDFCKSKRMFSASEMQQQVLYSKLDQVYHSYMPLGGSTTKVLKSIHDQYYSLPYVPNTAWQLRFGHIVGYGAKYYSYLMSRAVASRIWHHCFQKDPFSRAAGERYRNEVLAHGGGRHPVELVHGLLGEKPSTEMLVKSLVEDLEEDGLL